MGYFFYRLGTWIYHTIIRFSAPFNKKARAFIAGRKGVIEELRSLQAHPGPTVWVHCASLGEFEQGRPLIEAIRSEYPACRIILTFFSPSGYEVRKNYDQADHVCYLPVDSPGNARKFIKATDPSLAIFVKYEFWYHYFKELRRNQIPLTLVSSIFRPGQVFFRWYGGFFRSMLSLVDRIFTQDQDSLALLESAGCIHTERAGDTRFDRVLHIKEHNIEIDGVEAFRSGHLVMVVGSCWREDMELLYPIIEERTEFKFIIAPHEIKEEFLKEIESRASDSVRYSNFRVEDHANSRILLIDSIGMLSKLYAYGDYAFIGGAFGQGLHNILEAAVFGIPVFFGNRNFKKFREARELIELGGAFPVGDTDQLRESMRKMESKAHYDQIKGSVISYMNDSSGATDRIMEYIREKLHEGNSR